MREQSVARFCKGDWCALIISTDGETGWPFKDEARTYCWRQWKEWLQRHFGLALPSITCPEFKDLGSRSISKEGPFATSHCRFCSSNAQCCTPEPLGVQHGGQDGCPSGKHRLWTLVESLQSSECMSPRGPGYLHLHLDGASQSCRFRRKKCHSSSLWGNDQWSCGGRATQRPQSQRRDRHRIPICEHCYMVCTQQSCENGVTQNLDDSTLFPVCPAGGTSIPMGRKILDLLGNYNSFLLSFFSLWNEHVYFIPVPPLYFGST